MSWHSHPDASRIVREHWQDSQAFLVAQSEPCIALRDEEVSRIDRLLIGGVPEDLDAWNQPASWFIAVVVCPGDDLAPLADYVKNRGLDADRIHFYLHADTALEAMRPWADAGLPMDRVDDEVRGHPIRDWKDLHALLGRHFNERILTDALRR